MLLFRKSDFLQSRIVTRVGKDPLYIAEDFVDFFRFCHQTVPTLFLATWFALMKFPTLSRGRMLNGSIKNASHCYPLSPFPLESIHVRLNFQEVRILFLLIFLMVVCLDINSITAKPYILQKI